MQRLTGTLKAGALLFAIILIFFFMTNMRLHAEVATRQESDQVVNNWLKLETSANGLWAGVSDPRILSVQEIRHDDTLLGSCYSISPDGWVVVSAVKELPPVIACSQNGHIDFSKSYGMPGLVRDILLSRVRAVAAIYGGIETTISKSDTTLPGHVHRQDWIRLGAKSSDFLDLLNSGVFGFIEKAGPLLTSRWDQGGPYNDSCPDGDGGRCVAGCVAIAVAQVMRYHNWPQLGNDEKSYYWNGDQSCDGTTPGQTLSADFRDSYDWENMKDEYHWYSSGTSKRAAAELCYEVGVAYSMDYGHCASGSYQYRNSPSVMSTFFKYDAGMQVEDRDQYSGQGWFNIIEDEILSARPMLYRIRIGVSEDIGHAMVCDGAREIGGLKQYHINYGAGDDSDETDPDGAYNAWYSIDWLPYSAFVDQEYLIRNIRPDYPPEVVGFEVNAYPSYVLININFNEDIDESTINDENITIFGEMTEDHSWTYTFDHTSFQLSINTQNNFESSEWVRVTVGTGIKGTGGQGLAEPFTFNFSISPPGPDDNYEPNNTKESAYDLTAFSSGSLSDIDGLGIKWDYDWYRIQIPDGVDCYRIHCDHVYSEGDIDICLYNESITQWWCSQTSTDDDDICFSSPSPGIYYIKVFQDNEGNEYDLRWGSGCYDDVPLLSPASGSQFSSCDPEIYLTWELVDGVDRFEVEIDDDPDFSSLCAQLAWNSPHDYAEACYECCGGDCDDGVYYWRVRGRNRCGWGKWSDAWVFIIGQIPGTPSISGPSEACQGSTIQFSASATNNPTGWSWSSGCGGSFDAPQSSSTNWTAPNQYEGFCQISVTASNAVGTSDPGTKVVYVRPPSGVEEIFSQDLPESFRLSQNHPNPFNPVTKIQFSLPRRSLVTIDVYDLLGRRVRRLVNEELSAGEKVVTWDGKNDNGRQVSSGIYFYRIVTNGFVESKKMILLR